MPKRLALLVLTLVTFVVAWVGMQLLVGLTDWWPPGPPSEVLWLSVLALLSAPVAAAWLVARALAKRWRAAGDPPGTHAHRAFLWVLAAGYGLTTIVGIPAAQSRRDAWAVQEYKALKARGSKRVWDAHPYIRTYVAIPVLPCVILSYHEYQLDGLYGLGAFEIAVWYGVGVRSAEVWPLWVS